MNLLKNLKKYLLTVGLCIVIFELIFQIFFFFELKFITKADLYYNGYCDQKYWDLSTNRVKFKNDTIVHPKLSFVKEGIKIPKEIPKNIKIEKK